VVNGQEVSDSHEETAAGVAVIVDVQYILSIHASRYKSTAIDWKRLLNVLLAGR